MGKPKVLFYDIEASNLDANFGIVFCVGYKWADKDKVGMVTIRSSPDFKEDPTNDRYVVEKFKEVVEEADLLVGHYSSKYDLPFLNTKCLEHNLKPFKRVPQVDTWRIAKYQFKFNSNRLDTISKYIKTPDNKTPIDSKSWIRGVGGHVPSLKEIEHHCYKDILVLEQVYNKVKAFYPSHPDLSKLTDTNRPTCAVCSGKVEKAGLMATLQGKRQRYRCTECGHYTSRAIKKVVA